MLAMKVEDFHNSEIAERLEICTPTVKFHVSIIVSKMGVSSRIQAVANALRHNLVDGTG